MIVDQKVQATGPNTEHARIEQMKRELQIPAMWINDGANQRRLRGKPTPQVDESDSEECERRDSQSETESEQSIEEKASSE